MNFKGDPVGKSYPASNGIRRVINGVGSEVPGGLRIGGRHEPAPVDDPGLSGRAQTEDRDQKTEDRKRSRS